MKSINDSDMKMKFILMLVCIGLLVACKEKKEPLTEQKVEVVQKTQPEPVKPEEPKPVVKEMNYFLVAGCFEVYSNAERLNQKLLSEGYNSKIIPFYQLHMVTYNGYETRAEAQAELNRMVLKEEMEDIWLYPLN